MKELISIENIEIIDKVDDWQEAIRIAALPLVKRNFIEERYIQGIIDNTFKYGPYYVLAPNVAMPHAKPENGVLKKQIGILLLREPIKFSEDGFDVRLIIVLAATDSKSHLSSLKSLAEIIGDEECVGKIIQSNTREEVYGFFVNN